MSALIFCWCILINNTSAQINVDNVLFMGRSALSADDNITAIHYFNQAIQARPQHAQAYYFRGYAKFVLEDYHGAETDCTRSIELNPYISDVYLLRGLCRLNLSDFESALHDYTKALEDIPDDINARFNQAYCYLQLKQTTQADSTVNMVLSRSPKYYRAYMLKTQIALEEKDTLRGLVWVDSLLNFRPREIAAWQFKGQYALGKKEYAKADSFLSIAIKYEPENFDALLMRAMARNDMYRFDDAIRDYSRVIELVPQHFVAHYNRALIRALVGDDNKALDDFSFILQREPDNTLARYNRALLRERTGDFQGAITDYTELIKAYPNFIYGYYARANCRRKTGDFRGAISDETVVARSQLDLAFAQPRNRTIKEVRKRSDLELEDYDRPIAEEQDSALVFGDIVLGKVQNSQVEHDLMPPFQLALQKEPTHRYQDAAFIEGLDMLQKHFAPLELEVERAETGDGIQRNNIRQIFFTTDSNQEDIQAFVNHKLHLLPSLLSLSEVERSLIESMLSRQTYELKEALTYAHEAVSADSLSVLPLLHRASVMQSFCRNMRRGILTEHPNESDTKEISLFYQNIEADYATAQQIAPANAYVYYNRGCYYAERENWTAAIADFTKAIELDNNLPEAYYNRGLIYLSLKQKTKAIPDISKAGELGLYKAYNLLKQTRKQSSD